MESVFSSTRRTFHAGARAPRPALADVPAPQGMYADGVSFGVWRIHAFLYRDGDIEVYLVRHASLAMCAELAVYAGDDADACERFREDVRFRYDHRHAILPNLLGGGEKDGRAYRVVQRLEPFRLPHKDREVAKMLLELVEGLQFLHRFGACGFDLSPRRLLCRSDGTVAIGSLGERFDTRRLPRTSAPAGRVNPDADLHALGRLIRECYNGFPPWPWSGIARRALAAGHGTGFRSLADFAHACRCRHRARRVFVVLVVLGLLAAGAYRAYLARETLCARAGAVRAACEAWLKR